MFASEARLVRRTLVRALAAFRGAYALEVYLLPKSAMRELNRRFHGKDAPTNVLSFTSPGKFPHPDLPDAEYRGEVYLCPPVIREREESMEHLAVHGLLHLLGYTHAGKRDTMKMERKEKELLKRVMGNE